MRVTEHVPVLGFTAASSTALSPSWSHRLDLASTDNAFLAAGVCRLSSGTRLHLTALMVAESELGVVGSQGLGMTGCVEFRGHWIC